MSGPEQVCSCDGCWARKGHEVGCTCDADWGAIDEERQGM